MKSAPAWYKQKEQDEEEEDNTDNSSTTITDPVSAPDNASPPITPTTEVGYKTRTSIGGAFGAAILDRNNSSSSGDINNEISTSDGSSGGSSAPSWYSSKTKKESSQVTSDIPSWYAPKKQNISTEEAAPLPESGKQASTGIAGNAFSALDKALAKKSIPDGVFNDKALGIGALQGWCGVYAGRISTAENVGDYWYQKKTHIDHRSGIKAGDKILLPLGVGKDGKGYGHVMVAITDENANGDFAVAQSNADGRQNRGEGPGIASYGTYNVNELAKRYGQNWGAVTGKLKVNVFQKGVAASISQSVANRGAPPANASAKTLAQYVVDHGVTDLQSESWWKKAENKSEAWKIIQNTQGQDNGDAARIDNTGGTPTLSISGGLTVKAGTSIGNAFLSRLKNGPTKVDANFSTKVDDQAPPDINTTDYSAQALANYVVQNNISDLSSKKWWNDSPQKAEAWKLINKAKGRSEYFTEGATLSQGKIDSTADKAVNAMTESILGILDPNNNFSPNLTENQIAQRANVVRNLDEATKPIQKPIKDALKQVNTGAKDFQQYVAQRQEAVTGGEGDWWSDNPLIRGMFNATNMATEGVIQATGGGSGEDYNVVGGAKNLFFGALGFTPAGATFNTVTESPGIKPVAEAAFKEWGKVKEWVKTLPVVANLNRDGKELLDLGMDIGLFSLIHKGAKELKIFAKNKNVYYSPAEVKNVLRDITAGKNGEATPLRTELKKIFDGVKEGVDNKKMLKNSYKNGITVTEARNFTKWFNNFFGGLTEKSVIEPNLKPEFQKLLTDGKKAANGDISEIEFTKQAREILAKGESATLRDALPVLKNGVTPDMYDGSPNATSLSPALENIVRGQARLSDLQEQGKKTIISVEANREQPLTVDTYTYSDNKVGIGFNLSTEVAEMKAPISGKFENPREAVKAILPIIEDAVSKGSDIASEAVRSEIDKLKESKFSTVPAKGEIAPWEDNHTPSAPENLPAVKDMSKQAIEAEIKSTLDEYVKTALKNGKGQGVIATQHGRKTNNDNWYVKAFKENGGKRPTQAQIREIATQHLLNGVTDRSIGEMPPNARFRQLVERLPAAKPDRALKTLGEPAKIPNEAPVQIAEFKSTISTPESRLAGEQAPIVSEGKTAESQQRVPEGDKVPEYKKVKVTEQVAKAEKFVEENFELSKKIMRNLDSVPEDLDRGSVLSALRDKARDMGDTKLEAEAATALSKFKTRTAQDLALLKGDLNTTDYFIRKLLEARTKAKSTFSIEERSVNDGLQAEVNKLRKQLQDGMLADENGKIPKTPKQKRMRSIQEAQKILDLLTCK